MAAEDYRREVVPGDGDTVTWNPPAGDETYYGVLVSTEDGSWWLDLPETEQD